MHVGLPLATLLTMLDRPPQPQPPPVSTGAGACVGTAEAGSGKVAVNSLSSMLIAKLSTP
eukprot:COSAG02_NODE_51454_length_314_cov_0.697674_1_plen_59_part_01